MVALTSVVFSTMARREHLGLPTKRGQLVCWQTWYFVVDVEKRRNKKGNPGRATTEGSIGGDDGK
jgi:hypothetical protein